jgi:ribosomal protein L19E
MTALATTVSTLQTQQDNKNQSRGRNNGGNRGRNRNNDRRGRNGDRGGRGGARRPFQYCWSHRNCSHSGPDYEFRSDGHIKDATYANMQGGSTTCCHWLGDSINTY